MPPFAATVCEQRSSVALRNLPYTEPTGHQLCHFTCSLAKKGWRDTSILIRRYHVRSTEQSVLNKTTNHLSFLVEGHTACRHVLLVWYGQTFAPLYAAPSPEYCSTAQYRVSRMSAWKSTAGAEAQANMFLPLRISQLVSSPTIHALPTIHASTSTPGGARKLFAIQHTQIFGTVSDNA